VDLVYYKVGVLRKYMDRIGKIRKWYDDRGIDYNKSVDIPDEVIAQWALEENKEHQKKSAEVKRYGKRR
jgi:hypothetical protein